MEAEKKEKKYKIHTYRLGWKKHKQRREKKNDGDRPKIIFHMFVWYIEKTIKRIWIKFEINVMIFQL